MDSETKRYCVFCGSPADSKEHVFAKRLCKRAGAIDYPIIAGLYVEGKDTITRNPYSIQSVQVRQVCEPCNNNWMNELEEWFESRLGFLIEPEWPKLALPMIEELRTEPNKLAQWLMKTAVMFSLSSVQSEHPVEFSTEVTRQIKDGILPRNCWVDLAHSKFPVIGGGINRNFRVVNGRNYQPNQVIRIGDGFNFVLQYNHLLLRIAQAPSANVTYENWQGESPVRIYPTPSAKLPENFSYDNIMKFTHAVVLETWKDCPGNIV